MTLQASGQISLEDIGVEMGYSSSAEMDMDDLTSAAVGSSTISNEPDDYEDWYGYSNAPAAPSGVSGSHTAINTIRVSWTDNSTNEADFTIQFDQNGGGYSTVAVPPAGSGTGARTYDVTITCNKFDTYDIRVRANGTGGSDSAWAYSSSTLTIISCTL